MVILPSAFENTDGEKNEGINTSIKMSKEANTPPNFKGIPILAFALFVVIIASLIVVLYKPQINEPVAQEQNKNLLVPPDGMPYLGKIDATVTLIAVYNPLCAGCDPFYHDVEPQLMRNYIDAGLIKFYSWPILAISDSETNYNVLECAAEQGRYWEYRKILVGQPRPADELREFQKDDYFLFANEAGIKNKTEFASCLDENRYIESIRNLDQQRRDASIIINPSVVIEDIILTNPSFQAISAILDRKLAQ